jgi:tape measure domain-containing protein
MRGNGPLSFEATINDSNYQSRLDAMERRVLGFTNTAVQQAGRFESSFQNLGRLAVGAFAFSKLAELPQELLRVRGEFQQLEIAFTTMLRSKSKADAFLKEGAAFAATTPFNLRDVGTAQKQLLAYGFSVNEIIPSLKRLGDISAGLGLPFERLTYLYGTTKTQGRLFAQDLNQFVGSGIPLIAELAKQFGVAEDKVRGLVEDGKVGFSEVKKAIEGMTSGSGIFAGTLDAQSKSLLGLKERLGDAYAAMLNDIGKQNEGIAADLLNTATNVLQHYQDVIDILEVLIGSYGGYRAALLVASVAQLAQIPITEAQAIAQAQAANATGFLTLSQTRAAASTALLTRAQAALNGVMNLNPILLIGTALAALATAYFVFRDEVAKIKTAQELMAESGRQVATSFNKQQGEIKTLIGVIQNQNVAESERLKAYDKLKAIAPDITAGLDFQRAKTADLTKELNQYLVALRKRIELESATGKAKEAYDQQAEAAEKLKKAEEDVIANRNKTAKTNLGLGVYGDSPAQLAQQALVAARKAKADRDKVVSDIETSIGNIYSGKASKEQLTAEIDHYQRLAGSIADKLSPAYKEAEDNVKKFKDQLAALTVDETKGQAVKGKTIEQLEDEIKLKKESLSTGNTDAKNASINKEIDRLEAQKRKLTGDLSAAEKKAAKEAAKSGPFGSIDYYEQVSKKAGEILEKLSPKDTTKITQQSKIKFDADQKVEELRKQYTIKSFDEELADKRSKYELYQKWVDTYGQTSASKQFDALLSNGKTYVDYLNTEIARLETQKSKGALNEKDSKNLGSLLTQRDEATGKKTAIQEFNEDLQRAQAEAGSLSKYLAILKEKQDALGAPTNAPTDIAKRQKLAEEQIQTQQQLKLQLQQYLTDFAGSEQQQLAIRTKYTELRVALDTKFINNRNSEYKAALAILNSDEEKAIEDFQQRQLEKSDAYKKSTRVILEEGRKALKIQIANQQALVDKAKADYGEDSEAYKIAKKALNGLNKQLVDGSIGIINQYGQLLGQFGQALINLGGDAAESGRALVALGSSVDLITSSFAKGVDKSQLYANAVSGLITIFTAITEAAAKRKQAESEYYASVIAQQQQYNLLLNQQLGIRSKNTNPFIEDYTAQLQDNFEAQRKAQAKLDESLAKLNQGRAKEGLKNALDNTSALKLIGAGAGTGAAIGAIAGPAGAAIGAAVGAAVGALTSLFGGATKKADEFGALLERYPDLIQQSADGTKSINLALAQSLIDTGQLDDKTKALVQTTIEWQKQVDATKQAIQDIIKNLVGSLGDGLRDAMVNAFKDGTDAAKAFSDVLSKVVEDFVTKLLYTQIFAPYFKKLGEEMTKSLDTDNGGDGDIVDDLKRFQETSKKGQDQYLAYLQQWKDYANSMGFDVLKPTSASGTKNPNSIGQAIQATVTEQTANIIAGQLNAMRITGTDTNVLVRQQLLSLSGIEANTARIQRTNELLDSVDRRLKTIADSSTRGLGQPG